jgi:hypothetical protein
MATDRFVVSNYETPQDPQLAYELTPYSWIVQTRYHGPTDTRGSRITADLSNRPGRQRLSQSYCHALSSGANHTEAALEFMRSHILDPGADAELVCMQSSDAGYLFVFRDYKRTWPC